MYEYRVTAHNARYGLDDQVIYEQHGKEDAEAFAKNAETLDHLSDVKVERREVSDWETYSPATKRAAKKAPAKKVAAKKAPAKKPATRKVAPKATKKKGS